VALFKLIKEFETTLSKLEQNRSKFFIIRQLDDFRIKVLKERIKELREEVASKKKQKSEDHK
jgi:hypothetical protein